MLKLLFASLIIAILVHLTFYNVALNFSYISSNIIVFLVLILISYVALRIYLYFKVESEEEENLDAFQERKPKTFYSVKAYTKELKKRYNKKKQRKKN